MYQCVPHFVEVLFDSYISLKMVFVGWLYDLQMAYDLGLKPVFLDLLELNLFFHRMVLPKQQKMINFDNFFTEIELFFFNLPFSMHKPSDHFEF